MATDDYIAVTGDDWYERRRKDAAGKFWMSVAQQGPMKNVDTKQGIYFLTAGGKLLYAKNAGQNVEVMRDAFKQGLKAWNKLPESERAPGAIKIEDLGSVDSEYVRTPFPGGLVIDVHIRNLDKSENETGYCAACSTMKAGKEIRIESQRDHLWLTDREWKSLVPKNPKVGDTFPVPNGIAKRIFRFHLLDSTRGEPTFWKKTDVLSSELNLKVDSVADGKIEMTLEGAALMSTDPDTNAAKRGYDSKLAGKLVYNEKKNAFERFDIVAIGDHWGEGQYTPGARPGRTPLGFAFELASPENQAYAIPPEGAKNWWDYMNAK